jgi:hypothetical protein
MSARTILHLKPMTVKITQPELNLQQDLEARNIEVERAFQLITQSAKTLLSSFEHQKYRTSIIVNHYQSEKATTLISEFLCFFFNITLSMNRHGYKMIYFSYDEEAFTKFGASLYIRAMRVVFKFTMFENTKFNIEQCVRATPKEANVQRFFTSRLTNGANAYTFIDIEPKLIN